MPAWSDYNAKTNIADPIEKEGSTHECLRVLDMEIWRHRSIFTKDIMASPRSKEFVMREPGWGATVSMEVLKPTE